MADAFVDFFDQFFVFLAKEGFAPPVVGGGHARQIVAIICHGYVGGGVCPVFEDASVYGEQLAEHVGGEAGVVVPEDVVVRAFDDGDGVDLYVAEAFDYLCGAFFAGRYGRMIIETLRADGEAAGGG